jgi:ParB/RepB/Spo0J family partition protein
MTDSISVQMIPASSIVAGNNDRTTFDAAKLQELADSIKENGLAQPITIRPRASACLLGNAGPQYDIVAGERRFRAMTQLLQHESVPCLVRELTDEAASAIMLAENVARQDLNPIDEAKAYDARMSLHKWSVDDTARYAGVSEDIVKKRLKLLTLIPEAQQLIATGNLGVGHAEAMSRLDSNRQISALRILQASVHPLTVYAFQGICQQLYSEQCQDNLFTLENFWTAEVQKENPLPTRGKRAITGAPMRQDLPAIPFVNTDSIGQVFDRYISTLLDAGKETDAATLGTLYTFLVQNNWVRVPAASMLQREGN